MTSRARACTAATDILAAEANGRTDKHDKTSLTPLRAPIPFPSSRRVSALLSPGPGHGPGLSNRTHKEMIIMPRSKKFAIEELKCSDRTTVLGRCPSGERDLHSEPGSLSCKVPGCL